MATTILHGASTPKIDILSLTTCLGEKLEILPQMLSFTIFEDMFFPCMTGEIRISDSIGIFDQLPIAGNEKLTIKFSSYDYADDNRKVDFMHRTFDILKISDIKQINDSTKTYTLHFASPELKKNETIKISKSYQNTSISNVIATILTEDYESDEAEPRGLGLPTIALEEIPIRSKFLTDADIEIQYQKVDDDDSMELFVEKTKYIEPFITIPYSKPFDIIQNLAARSIRLCGGRNGTAEKSTVVNFVFFENKRGYQFTTVESLLEDKDNMPIFKFSNAAQNLSSQSGERTVERNTIEKLEIMDLHDVIGNIHNGTYASRLLTYDISTGELITSDYDYAKEFPNTESTERADGQPDYPMVLLDKNGESQLTDKVFSRYLLAPTIIQGIDLITSGQTQRINDTKTLIGTQEYMQKRMSQLGRLNNIKLMIEISGNSKHKVGDMVTLDLRYMPSFDGNSAATERKIKYYSGNYLITAIKHMVTFLEYKMIIELSKDSSIEKIGSL